MENQNNQNNKSTKFVAIFAVLIALIAAGIAVYFATRPAEVVDNNANIQIDTRATDEEKAANPLANRQVFFSGINDADVNAKTVVYLENLPENEDFYMTYQVEDKDSGEIVFETGLIPAGEHVEWTIGDSLSVGEHNLIFHEKPFWLDAEGNKVPLTSGNNEAVFTVH